MRRSSFFAHLLPWVCVGLAPAPAFACSDAGPRNAECNDGGAAWITCSTHDDCPSGQLCDVGGRCACGSECAYEQACDGGACRCVLGDAPDGGPGCETELLCGYWSVLCVRPDAGRGLGPEAGAGMDGGSSAAPASGGCAAAPGGASLPWTVLGLLAVGACLARRRRRGRREDGDDPPHPQAPR